MKEEYEYVVEAIQEYERITGEKFVPFPKWLDESYKRLIECLLDDELW